MIRFMVIALLIAVGFSSCNSIRYTSYNRPFDFVKLQHNNWRLNAKTQSLDTIKEGAIDYIKPIEIITTPLTENEVVQKVESASIIVDSSVTSSPKAKNKPSIEHYQTEYHIHFDKGNTSDYKPENNRHKTKNNNSSDWDNFLLALLLAVIAIIVLALILAYLSQSPIGQVILAAIIIVLIIAGLIAAIAYNDTVILDILELLLIFL